VLLEKAEPQLVAQLDRNELRQMHRNLVDANTFVAKGTMDKGKQFGAKAALWGNGAFATGGIALAWATAAGPVGWAFAGVACVPVTVQGFRHRRRVAQQVDYEFASSRIGPLLELVSDLI
jgi:hypothetical protein